jgi:prepilin-type N-terminal cleavage/methylation domain-containing protein
MWASKQHKGFTIVELLIVIVVIGVLAAIVIVAYNGITAKANQAAAQSSVEQISKGILSYMVQNSDQVPSDLTSIQPATGNATYQYTTGTTTSPQTFCVSATVGGKSYYIDNTSHTNATSGTCTVTNLATNPKLDTAATGYGSAVSATGAARNAIAGLAGFSFGYTATVSAVSDRIYLQGTSSLIVGQVYTASMWAKDTTGASFAIQTTDNAGTQYALGSSTTANGSWQRLSVSFTPTSTTWRVVARQLSATAGTLGMTGVMVTQGPVLYSYADGDQSAAGWSWTGTVGNSTSTGPSF